MAMAAAFVMVEVLTLVASPTILILEPLERARLMSSSKSFSTDARRMMILGRIVPLWMGWKWLPHFFFTYET